MAFVQQHGTGFLAYKNPNDNNGAGFGSMPYQRRMLMFDANDLVDVINGTKNPYDPFPYTTWDMNVAGSLLPTGSVVGVAYDDSPLDSGSSLLYVCTTAQNPATDFAAYIHVWTVNH